MLNDIYSNQELELRRGTIVLAILHELKERKYGYALLQSLEQAEIAIEAGTLYPMLRRLEKQGVLKSAWDTTDTRPRKYYELSTDGKKLYKQLEQEWLTTTKTLLKLLNQTL